MRKCQCDNGNDRSTETAAPALVHTLAISFFRSLRFNFCILLLELISAWEPGRFALDACDYLLPAPTVRLVWLHCAKLLNFFFPFARYFGGFFFMALPISCFGLHLTNLHIFAAARKLSRVIRAPD